MVFSYDNERIEKLIIIPGAQKSGTSTLFRIVSSFDKVAIPNSKEPQFFCMPGKYIEKNLEEYKSNRYKHKDQDKIPLDGSTFYLYDNRAIKNINKYVCKVKILIILRDPATRAYSSYYQMRKKLPTVERRTFADVLSSIRENTNKYPVIDYDSVYRAEEETIIEAIRNDRVDGKYLRREYSREQKFLDMLLPYRYFSHSFYSEYIERYKKVFTEDNIKIVNMKDLVNKEKETISNIAHFLNIDNYQKNKEIPNIHETIVPQSEKVRKIISYIKNSDFTHKAIINLKKIMPKEIINTARQVCYTKRPKMKDKRYIEARKILEEEYEYLERELNFRFKTAD